MRSVFGEVVGHLLMAAVLALAILGWTVGIVAWAFWGSELEERDG